MLAAGFELSFRQTVVGSTFANITQLIPINTLGSFGTLEAGWTLGYALIGIDAKQALTAGFVLHLLVFSFLIFSAFPSWIWLEHGKYPLSKTIGK